MHLVLIILFLFPLTMVASQEPIEAPPPPGFDDGFEVEMPSNLNVGVALFSGLLNSPTIRAKLQNLYDLLDLKARFARIVTSAITRANLILLRRILDFVSRVCHFLMGYLPEVEKSSDSGLLRNWFPVVNFNTVPQNIASTSTTDRSNDILANPSVELEEEEQKLLAENHDRVLDLHKLLSYNQ